MFVVFSGYIDLSKRRVSPEEIKKCEEKFTKAKTVCQFPFVHQFKYLKSVEAHVSTGTQWNPCENHNNNAPFLLPLQVYSILRHCAEILGFETDEQLEELYEKTAWYFDEKYKVPGRSYEIFKLAVGYVCGIPTLGQ